jgi:2',3'-cyclic-nucleotide 2'-phosphodiesterase (5'-nucleotidase family)
MKVTLSIIYLFVSAVSAQFQFFDQFFGGHQQQQAPPEKQNVASDSTWYRQTWEGGEYLISSSHRKWASPGCLLCSGNSY